jgi:hypothetical protein
MDIEDNDPDSPEDDDDLFMSSFRGTSPIDSAADDTDGGGSNTDIVYEVDDTDNEDDIVPEKPAESAQAELSM